jgi:hypothetical protein
MNYDEYGDPISGCHKRRLAKVTLYLEVPAVNSETETWYTEDELCKQIEDNLPDGFETTSWSDINISDIEGDDQSKFKNPVGFLTPDGKFFLIETEENGLAHLALARRVHDLYEPTITERIYGTSYEQWLENAGFIKIHCSEVRYFANKHYHGFYDQPNARTPKVTEQQRQALYEYFKTHRKFAQIASINDYNMYRKNIPITKWLREADDIQLQKIFEL